MTILPEIEFYCKAFKNSSSIEKIKPLNILLNTNNNICFNKNLIDLIENEIEDKNLFQSIVKDLFDNNRVLSDESSKDLSYNEQLEELYNKINIEYLIPLILDESSKLNEKGIFNNVVNINDDTKFKKDLIVTSILLNKTINYCYNDFKTNIQINSFFEEIFKIPKVIKNVYVFNREQDVKYLEPLKSKNIEYYTLMTKMKTEKYIHLSTLRDMRRSLGGRLKIFSTNNYRIIHERKIIIDGFIINSDNSFQNLTVDEPTWEISLTFCSIKQNAWLNKRKKFIQLTN